MGCRKDPLGASVLESYKVGLTCALGRTLNFKQLIKKFRQGYIILGVTNACLTGTTWGGCATTLRISIQALVFSAALLCVTVWSRTPHVKVDVNVSSAIWTISSKPTHVFQLLVVTGIALMGIRGKRSFSYWQ